MRVLTAALAAAAMSAPALAQVEVTPGRAGVTASAHDGNLPAHTVDRNSSTRWSASGDGQWIRFDLGATQTLSSVRIAFYRAGLRRSLFDLQVSTDGNTWSTALAGVQSSGASTKPETFTLPNPAARFLRYLGHGTDADSWNSLVEVQVFAAEPSVKATAGALTTSTFLADTPPLQAVDNNLATRWSAEGDGQWLTYDLDSVQNVRFVKLGHHRGDQRISTFDLQLSSDGVAWTNVRTLSRSSGLIAGLETFDFPDRPARYVRYVGHGNTENAWASLTEMEVYVAGGPSPHVQLGANGRLAYLPYANGDLVPDFSYAGYGGGGVALPVVPVRAKVSPGAGDDGAAIQAAIDQVSALPLDANGFRGAVLLSAGTYEIAGSLTIAASGVVLRGAGDGPGGTLLRATGTAVRELIRVQGAGSRSEVAGTRRAITSTRVPAGARTFTVASTTGYQVGDDVVVERTPNQEWIDSTGTDDCTTVGTAYDTADVDGESCISASFWTPSSRIMRYERKVTAVSGNQITVDAPLVEAVSTQFGGGAVYKYLFAGRIQKCGVEHLRAESAFVSDTDEAHATHMIALGNVAHAWVQRVTSVYFVQGTVLAGAGAKWVTVQDSASLDHKSQITGGRRYPFSLDDSSYVLVMRCYASTGRHDFVTGSNTAGPNVFLDSRAEVSFSELGPHHRWATGSLFDNIVHQSQSGTQTIGAYNRGNLGTGHGWSGGYQLFWNCIGDRHKLAAPPDAHNWSIGCRTTSREGNGTFESYGTPVAPWSLYLQQLRDRLGSAALTAIGY